MKRMSSKYVIAMNWSWDQSDLDEYRYHYGRTSIPVYGVGEKYYCATPIGKKPATHRDGIKWNWQESTSLFAKQVGWIIWEA